MPTTPVYDLLLQEVTDDLERRVLSALINHAGERVTRPQLVFEVFGVYVQSCELANNTDDRKVREAIERLQRREFPILASSGQAGYILVTDDKELDDYVGEIVSRVNQMQEKANALRKSRKWILFIKAHKANQPAVQASMFGKPTVYP